MLICVTFTENDEPLNIYATKYASEDTEPILQKILNCYNWYDGKRSFSDCAKQAYPSVDIYPVKRIDGKRIVFDDICHGAVCENAYCTEVFDACPKTKVIIKEEQPDAKTNN